MIAQSKIGVGVITCNRIDLFRQAIKSLPETDEMVVVNDGIPYPAEEYPGKIKKVFQNKNNIGAGRSKNVALSHLLSSGCTHIFLVEDDIRIKNHDIFEKYIKAAEVTGIGHFNYGYHGPLNKNSESQPAPRAVVDFMGIRIAFNRHIIGAFSYYRRDVLEKVGLMDPVYFNTLDHVDHTYRIIKAGFHPPFWWFADLEDSPLYIEDLDPLLSRSVNRKRSLLFELRQKLFARYFLLKNHALPGRIKDLSEKEVMQELERIKNLYCGIKP